MSEQHWDVEADGVVLGSGGAALVAALSARHHAAKQG
jgi:succinate dehydrogenase/fumarate reductase flavoprotein subunit